MPKSRFNAVREKARAQRHNPIHRAATEGSTNDAEATASLTIRAAASNGHGSGDVLPVLKALPLPSSAASTSATAHEDALWALTSLTGFLAVKTQRNELLAPKHDLVARILLQLHGDRPIEVRDAASGCLRNLCIEAGGKVRKALEAKGCVMLCIEEVQRVAQALHLIEGGDASEAPFLSQSLGKHNSSLLNKPESEMNRKERRHAAKAKAAAEKRRGKETNGESITIATDHAMEVESTAQPTQEAAAATESEDDKTSIRCSHLHNLSAVLWCLTEVSPQAVEQCEWAAPVLCRVFSQAVRRGTQALRTLQTDDTTSNITSDAGKIDVGRKDQMVIERAWVEAASGCLNALVTLSDSNARICAALVGISRQELMSALKGKAKSVAHVLDDTLHDDLPRAQGRENLTALCSAVTLLQGVVGESSEGVSSPATPLVRQIHSLGLLSLAAIRNVQASLPAHLRQDIKAAVADAEPCSLSTFETHAGLACLGRMLQRASSLRADDLATPQVPGQSGTDATAASLTKLRQAQEEFGNLNLALEILAELIGDREGWSKEAEQGESSKRPEGLIVDEDDVDVDSDADDEMQETSEDDDDEVAEGNLMDEEDDVTGDVKSTLVEFRQTRIAKALTGPLLESLLRLAFISQESSTLLTQTHEASASLRGVTIRALSVLSNAVLVLASYAQPPPSQPVGDAMQQKRIASFQTWLTQSPQNEWLCSLWRWSFEMASRAASSPLLAVQDHIGEDDEARHLASAEAKRIVESCLGIMWSVSRCYEGVGGNVAAQVLVVESSQFANDKHYTTASQGNGVVESLLAAYKSSKQDSTASSSAAAGLLEGATLTAVAAAATPSDVTTWASGDGVRVHCLGVLSTLARQAHVWPNHLPSIVTLLSRVLDALPPQGAGRQAAQPAATSASLAALELADWTSFDGMVVAVNGMIDTFADEMRPWDRQYTALKLQGKLKRASTDVRVATRAIDKRKQTGLRVAADEACGNLMGFLQYRESLK